MMIPYNGFCFTKCKHIISELNQSKRYKHVTFIESEFTKIHIFYKIIEKFHKSK